MSCTKEQKGVARHHNRQSHPCQSVADVINWQTKNIIHLHIEALVCLLHSFPLDLSNAGVLFAISSWTQGMLILRRSTACAKSAQSEGRHRAERLGERQVAQGRAPCRAWHRFSREWKKATGCYICPLQHTLGYRNYKGWSGTLCGSGEYRECTKSM